MQKITAPIEFEEEMFHFILRRYLGSSQTVLEKHPPNQGVEPRIDPMLESMSLNLMRLRAQLIIGPTVFLIGRPVHKRGVGKGA